MEEKGKEPQVIKNNKKKSKKTDTSENTVKSEKLRYKNADETYE